MDLPALPAFFRPIALASVASTNDELKRYAGVGADEGTLIVTAEQTAGRGRLDRTWISPPGNLYASLLLRPRRRIADALSLSFLAAVAVGDAAASLLPETAAAVGHKWPNDVLVGGRKLAGILLESATDARGRLDWLIVGVGVNVASHPVAGEAAYPATSLAAEGAPDADEARVLSLFCHRFLAGYRLWLADGFAPVREAWLKRALGLGEEIRVDLDGETVSGTFVGLADDGALILQRVKSADCRRITAGDVFLPSI